MCRVIPLDAHRKARQGAAERGASGRATVEPPLPAASLDSSAGPTLRGRIVKRGVSAMSMPAADVETPPGS
jgi:hypothetical protein